MDKYEYKLKTEQMLELMEDGAFNKAAEIADSIDWKRVRNTKMLTDVSDIYEKNGDYQKSYEVLNIAYHRAEGSRKIVYRLYVFCVFFPIQSFIFFRAVIRILFFIQNIIIVLKPF